MGVISKTIFRDHHCNNSQHNLKKGNKLWDYILNLNVY